MQNMTRSRTGLRCTLQETFYFDTLRMSSLYLWREFGDLRSEMGFFPLVWGMLSVWGGLSMDLA